MALTGADMSPINLKSQIFLDGGDPSETKETIRILGFLDGQTTNPTLISKNPDAQKRIAQGKKFSREEVLDFYRDVVLEISSLLPQGSVSVEVYADASTKSDEMLREGQKMFSWIPTNAHIKFPTVTEGLKAAGQALTRGLRVNMTLCFTQEQAAAVYAATKGANKGDVFVSPFIGRLDDQGENGMDLISNIIGMYREGDGHVEVLTASVRNIDHFLYALKLGSDIITAPFSILKEWSDRGLPIPGDEYTYESGGLKPIPAKDIALTGKWTDYDIRHGLTDKGLERFASDWNSLIA
jgi:transaldolase